MRSIVILSAAVLAGCATTSDAGKPAPESVSFEVTPCFGSCPVFSITVDRNGKGVYEGGRFVKVKGRHEFRASPAQLAAFFDRIEPFRPKGTKVYDYGHCPVPVSTDSPNVNVSWGSPQGSDALNWYLGCRVEELSKIEPDLYRAWKELPLDDLVGTSENRFEYDQRGG